MSNEKLGFLSYNEFIVDEKVSVFKFEDSYLVYDVNGEVIGAIQQNSVSGGAKAARILLGNNMQLFQKFSLTMLNADGTKIGSIYRNGGGFSYYTIEDGLGNIVMKFKKPYRKIKDENGNFICKLGGMLRTFTLKAENDEPLVTIEHKWNGAKSIFTSADKYHIEFSSFVSDDARLWLGAIAVAYDKIVGD